MRAKRKRKTKTGLPKIDDPRFEKLVKDIVEIIKSTSKEIDKIRKNFPGIPNPLKPTKRSRKK